MWSWFLIRYWLRQILFYLAYPYYRFLKKKRSFIFRGVSYTYLWHYYNATWLNERSVEIPIIWHIIKTQIPGKILEVGSVLQNYFPIQHDVLDKYDKTKNIINEDALDFRPQEKYDLIVSISTIEHMGFDEAEKDPQKILRVIENLKIHCLAEKGTMVITFPIGYNPSLDTLLSDGKIPFSEMFYLQRTNAYNDWVETDYESVKNKEMNHPFPFANAIAIGIYKKN